jgi:hypothetical protein
MHFPTRQGTVRGFALRGKRLLTRSECVPRHYVLSILSLQTKLYHHHQETSNTSRPTYLLTFQLPTRPWQLPGWRISSAETSCGSIRRFSLFFCCTPSPQPVAHAMWGVVWCQWGCWLRDWEILSACVRELTPTDAKSWEVGRGSQRLERYCAISFICALDVGILAAAKVKEGKGEENCHEGHEDAGNHRVLPVAMDPSPMVFQQTRGAW